MLERDLKKVYVKKMWQRQWALCQLASNWAALVGEKFAQVTMPAFFRRNVLWVYVQNSTVMQCLQLSKPDTLQRIRCLSSDADIEDMLFALYPSGLPEGQRKRWSPSKPVHSEDDRAFKQLVQSVTDAASQDALYRLWRAHSQLGGQ
ncbi:MAG: hypothetical protein CSA33_01375 [Desulfobulbus propionicus]|nr:MAG: hypothetical protein CSA33_01375 [Desulfobulbus propionicus]